MQLLWCMRERTNFDRGVLSLFLCLRKNYSEMKRNGQGQIKTCRRKQHVKTDGMKGISNLFCGIFAVGGNYNLTRDTSNSIDIALGTNVKVPGGFTLVVKEYGVEVQGVTNWNNQKESQDASDMAGALATLLRNASGQLQHVGTDSRQITQWNEDVEKVLGYFGIDISRDFTVNGVKYVRDGSGVYVNRKFGQPLIEN